MVRPQIEDGASTALTLSQAVIYNESAETVTATVGAGILIVDTAYEFALIIAQGIGFVHIPLVVSAINDQPMEIETIRDFYDAIASDNVKFLIMRDAAMGQWRSYLGQGSRGTLADWTISHDTGIIAVMDRSVILNLKGDTLGTNGVSTINLQPGTNLIGLPLQDDRLGHVSDLLNLEGISGNATAFIVLADGRSRW